MEIIAVFPEIHVEHITLWGRNVKFLDIEPLGFKVLRSSAKLY